LWPFIARLQGRSIENICRIGSKGRIWGVTDLDEEKFLTRNWEEGEIIILD
jgi:hypothetical protein